MFWSKSCALGFVSFHWSIIMSFSPLQCYWNCQMFNHKQSKAFRITLRISVHCNFNITALPCLRLVFYRPLKKTVLKSIAKRIRNLNSHKPGESRRMFLSCKILVNSWVIIEGLCPDPRSERMPLSWCLGVDPRPMVWLRSVWKVLLEASETVMPQGLNTISSAIWLK